MVNEDIEIGRRIVAALTRTGIPVKVYLWAFIPQLQEWQFMIATPLVDSKGPLAAYGEVNKALQKEGVFEDVPLRRIFLKSPNDKVLKSLEKESKAVPQESFQVVNEQITGSFVEDAYLYKGFIHILREDDPSGRESFLVLYAPNNGPKRGRVRLLQSVEDVGRFLREEVRLPENIVGPKVKELRERGGVSISNVLLGPHDLRRLGIG